MESRHRPDAHRDEGHTASEKEKCGYRYRQPQITQSITPGTPE